MKVQVDKIPQYLKEYGLFCNWKYELRNGKKTKVPYTPGTTRKASVSDPAAFTAFETASYATGYDGIGVRVCDRLVGIDIDHCIVMIPFWDIGYAFPSLCPILNPAANRLLSVISVTIGLYADVLSAYELSPNSLQMLTVSDTWHTNFLTESLSDRKQ